MCAGMKETGGGKAVPNFTTAGFSKGGSGVRAQQTLAEAHAKAKNLKALDLKACLGANYNSDTDQICFTVPLYGDVCVTSPIKIPFNADIQACVQTCGSGIIPSGVEATIYVNGSDIWSGTVFGSC